MSTHSPGSKGAGCDHVRGRTYPSKLHGVGASGCLTKRTDVDEMLLVIKKVASGHWYVSAEIAQQLALRSLLEQEGSSFDQVYLDCHCSSRICFFWFVFLCLHPRPREVDKKASQPLLKSSTADNL